MFLKNKNAWILIIAILGAELGMWFGLIGNLDFLQKHLQSSFEQSTVLLIGTLSGFLAGPMIGRVIDIYNKRNLLILASLVRILGAILMLIAVLTNNIAWMLFSMIFIGIAASLYFPVIQAITPLIVEEKKLIGFNALQMNVMTLARIIGTAIAGVLLLAISLKFLYIYSIALYCILLISSLFLKLPSTDTQKKGAISKKKNIKFRDVFEHLKDKKIILGCLLLSFIPYIFISAFNIIVIEISKIQNDPSIKALLYSIEGSSIIVTGLFVKKALRKIKDTHAIFIACMLIVVSQVLLIFPEHKLVSLLSFFLFGIACGIFMPVSSTLYQKHIGAQFMGRFFSLRRIIETCIAQISLITIGLFLDWLGLSNLMICTFIISILLITTAYIIFFKGLLIVDKEIVIMKGGE